MNKVFAVGIGPGSAEFLTQQARAALEEADLLCGYTTYLDLVRDLFPDKPRYATPMTKERDRCLYALEQAAQEQENQRTNTTLRHTEKRL